MILGTLSTHRSFAALALPLIVILVAATSCDGSKTAAGRGGPFANAGGTADAAATDAGSKDGPGVDSGKDGAAGVSDAKTDAASEGRADVPAAVDGAGGAVGSNGGMGGIVAGAGGAGTPPLPTCDACEQANCSPGHNMLPDYITACHAPKDASGQPAKAAGGPAAGMPRKDLCEAVLACVRQNPDKCVTWAIPSMGFEDVQPCWCGKDVSDDDCVGGKAKGPCKAQIEAASEIGSSATAGSDVAQNFVDWQTYAIGAAVTLTSECDLRYCRASCLGLPGPNSLAGSGSGAGGSSGSTGGGGRSGGNAGGATGTAGATGAAGAGGLTGGTGAGTGAGGGGRGGSGGGGTAGSSSTTTYNTCHSCEQTMCPEFLSSCEQAAGTAAMGPAAGTARKDLCLAVVACVRATRCSIEGDVAPCYCGTADMSGACMGGAANGSCKSQIEAAAESTDPAVVTGERFTNPDPYNKMPFAIGFATDLIGCDGFLCNEALCVTGDPASTGGAAGTAGRGGGGGGGGVGGRAGTGAAGGGGSTDGGGVGGARASGGAGGATASAGAMGTGGLSASGGGGGTAGAGAVPAVLANGRFDSGGSPWSPEFGMDAVWTGTRDMAGSATSGVLDVRNSSVFDADGSTMGGARQCIVATPGVRQAVSAQMFIPAGQGSGSAGVDVLFFPSGDCSGAVNGEYTPPLVTTTNAWTLVQGTTPTPAGARSMAVRLVIVKTFRAASFQTYFDNVSCAPQ